jgi:hypothetical protein
MNLLGCWHLLLSVYLLLFHLSICSKQLLQGLSKHVLSARR